MNETTASAQVVLANTFLMYFKAHSYHWNVEGKDFPQFHDFFGDIYEDLYGAVDPMAENIRKMHEYAPRNLDEMYRYKTIDCANAATTIPEMLHDLLIANEETIISLNKLFGLLTAANEQGFADFIAARLDAHKKHSWMITSTLKGAGQ
jgi:starvation-inducible DNA-binding protein